MAPQGYDIISQDEAREAAAWSQPVSRSEALQIRATSVGFLLEDRMQHGFTKVSSAMNTAGKHLDPDSVRREQGLLVNGKYHVVVLQEGVLNMYTVVGYAAGAAPVTQLDVCSVSTRIIHLWSTSEECLELTVRDSPGQRFLLQVPEEVVGEGDALHAWTADLEAVRAARNNWGVVKGVFKGGLDIFSETFAGGLGGGAGWTVGHDAGAKISAALGLR